MEGEIINRVALSPLVSVDLADFRVEGERILFDLKDQLFMGMLLKEKDFRAFVKNHDWSDYQDKHVGIHCSVDTIIPVWAYMILVSALEPFAKTIVFGGEEELETHLYTQAFSQLDTTQFQDKKLVVKGCGDVMIPAGAFVEFTKLVRPIANKIMYGEPCSSVPVFKKARISK